VKILQFHLGQAGIQQQLGPIRQLERICSLSLCLVHPCCRNRNKG